jgi:hypothetical protein
MAVYFGSEPAERLKKGKGGENEDTMNLIRAH